MKLIDKDALVVDIEKLIKCIYAGREYVGISLNEENIVRGLQKAEDIINTLEVKEMDLEKEIRAFAKMELEPIKIYDANVGITITMHQLYQCAKHFFELGLQAQKGE